MWGWVGAWAEIHSLFVRIVSIHMASIEGHWPSNRQTEDAKEESERSAKEIEELQQQLSKAAADTWLILAQLER